MTYTTRNRRAEKYIDEEGFVRDFISKDDVNKIVDDINKRVDNLVVSGGCAFDDFQQRMVHEHESAVYDLRNRVTALESSSGGSDSGTCLTQSLDFKPFVQIAPEDWEAAQAAGEAASLSQDQVLPMPASQALNLSIESTMSTAFHVKYNHESRIEAVEKNTITAKKVGKYEILKSSDNQLSTRLVNSTDTVLSTTDKIQTDLRNVVIPFVNDSRSRIVSLEDNKSDVDTMLTEWTNGKKDLNDALERVENVESSVSSINGDISSLQTRITVLENLDGADSIAVGPQMMGSNAMNTFIVTWKNENGDSQSRTLVYGETDSLDQVIDWIHDVIKDSVTDINTRISNLENGSSSSSSGTNCDCSSSIASLQTQYDGLQESTQTATSTLFDRYDALSARINSLKAAIIKDLDYIWGQLRTKHTDLPEIGGSSLTSWNVSDVM